MRIELARAGLENVTAWLAWLRALELFGLRWQDWERIDGASSAQHDLPAGTSMFLLQLLEDTKTSKTKTADMVMAGETASGLRPIVWYDRLHALLSDFEPSSFHFVHEDGRRWDSRYFCTTYLLPSLMEQRLNGDPHLIRFNGTPGNSLAENFWSMHSYRRGARTTVSKKRSTTVRQATSEEVFEHRRWRVKRSGMTMPQAYLGWTIADRFAITRLCM
jgi:hypothetical protein